MRPHGRSLRLPRCLLYTHRTLGLLTTPSGRGTVASMWGDGMKNKVAAARSVSLGFAAAKAILALPRGTKRLIMATTDAVAIPTALWAAFVLKFDRLDPVLDRTLAYFLVAVASALL